MKLGRRPIPLEKKKTNVLVIPFTDGERELLEKAYTLLETDYSMTGFYRSVILKKAGNIVKEEK